MLSAVFMLARMYGIPLKAFEMWDPDTESIFDSEDAPLAGEEYVLARHDVPKGYIGILLSWSQHIWTNRNLLNTFFELPWLNKDVGFWSVKVGEKCPQDLDRIYSLKNVWDANAGNANPCFYMTELEASPTSIEISYTKVSAIYSDDYRISGRIIGIDIPKEQAQKIALPVSGVSGEFQI